MNKERQAYVKPRLVVHGDIETITLNCNLPPLADTLGGQAGTACPPGS